jgi:hypothetical protein
VDGGGNAVGKDEQGLVERLYGAIGMAKRGVVQSQLSLSLSLSLFRMAMLSSPAVTKMDVLAHLHPYVGILFVPDLCLLNCATRLLDFPGSSESRGAH